MLMRKMKQGNDSIDDDYRQIMSLLTSDRMKRKLEARYKSALETVSGKESVDFNYENFSGGKTSLQDLSGKLIYIDVWATWCGPCLKEMPSLKKLVKDKSKNGAFSSCTEKGDPDKITAFQLPSISGN